MSERKTQGETKCLSPPMLRSGWVRSCTPRLHDPHPIQHWGSICTCLVMQPEQNDAFLLFTSYIKSLFRTYIPTPVWSCSRKTYKPDMPYIETEHNYTYTDRGCHDQTDVGNGYTGCHMFYQTGVIALISSYDMMDISILYLAVSHLL